MGKLDADGQGALENSRIGLEKEAADLDKSPLRGDVRWAKNPGK